MSIALDFRFPLQISRIVLIMVKTVEQLGRQACMQLQAYFLGFHPETCLESISQFTSSVDHVTASNVRIKDMPVVWRS